MSKRKADPSSDTVGARMRDIRKQQRMTLERLSERTGISVSSLSRIENTQLGMTIEKVEKVADALGVAPETLISRSRPTRSPALRRTAKQDGDDPRFIVDRAKRRKPSAERELSIEYLFDRESGRAMDCMHLTIQSISVWESEFVRHPGEKIIYVIDGAAVVYCRGRSPLVLEAGDSLYMDAAIWHSVVGVNGRTAELLVTIYPGPDALDGPFETQMFDPESWADPQ
jgi:transcriptional regulator with XRE-family HTH domain